MKPGDKVYAGKIEVDWGTHKAKVVIESTTIKTATEKTILVKDRLSTLGYGSRFAPSTKHLFTSRRACLEALRDNALATVARETGKLEAVIAALAKEQ